MRNAGRGREGLRLLQRTKSIRSLPPPKRLHPSPKYYTPQRCAGARLLPRDHARHSRPARSTVAPCILYVTIQPSGRLGLFSNSSARFIVSTASLPYGLRERVRYKTSRIPAFFTTVGNRVRQPGNERETDWYYV